MRGGKCDVDLAWSRTWGEGREGRGGGGDCSDRMPSKSWDQGTE